MLDRRRRPATHAGPARRLPRATLTTEPRPRGRIALRAPAHGLY